MKDCRELFEWLGNYVGDRLNRLQIEYHNIINLVEKNHIKQSNVLYLLKIKL